jgi:mycothiol synthase
MPPFDVVRRLDTRAAAALHELATAAEAATDHSVMDQHRLATALAGTAPGFLAALAWKPDQSGLAGYVQALRGVDGWDIQTVAAPASAPATAGDPAGSQLPANSLRPLLAAVVDALAGEKDTTLRLWAYRADADTDRMAATVGLEPVRDIHQMRRPLPTGEPYELDTRPFVVGQDEDAWLAVNNRAFAGHPDQSGWARSDIDDHEHEPWFDPDGFLLHDDPDTGELAGFCWTKVHASSTPPMGEIYVIGVDPGYQAVGLGRRLVLAGLDHLAGAGLTTGMLYVDGTNTKAVRLYTSMGLTIDHTDRVYGHP